MSVLEQKGESGSKDSVFTHMIKACGNYDTRMLRNQVARKRLVG